MNIVRLGSLFPKLKSPMLTLNHNFATRRHYHLVKNCSPSIKPSSFTRSIIQSGLQKVNCSSLPAVKQKTKSEGLWRLLSLAKPVKWKIAGAVVLMLISSGVTMIVPFSIGKLIDVIYSPSMNFDEMMTTLTKACFLLGGIFVIGATANGFRVYLIQLSGQRIVNSLRKNVFASVMNQEAAFFDVNQTGELTNRLSNDTAVVGKAVTDNVSDGLRSAAMAIGGISLMFYSSPGLATLALGIVPPVVLIAVVYGRFMKRITTKVQNALASSTEVAEERISNIKIVKAFGKEGNEIRRYDDKVEDIITLAKQEAVARSIFFGFTGLSGNAIVLTVLYNGGSMMSHSLITVGDLTSFLLYTVYVGMSIAGLSSFYSELMKGIGATNRLWYLVDRQPIIPISGGLTPSILNPSAGISFNNVHFSYPSRPDAKIFQGINLEMQANSTTAIVGASGSGKSTLGSLLLRLYDPDTGEVTIDGNNLKDLNPKWIKAQIGSVEQNPILFSSTIADNISYSSDEDVSMLDIENAARQANAHDFISDFPDGFQTVVGERGQMLSGGERQRIAIARAILKNPRFLLLDEATSALDAESEHLVQDALLRLMVGRTAIIIAHRLSTIRAADRIVVLSNGQIVESGSYEQLVDIKGGFFQNLVEKQSA